MLRVGNFRWIAAALIGAAIALSVKAFLSSPPIVHADATGRTEYKIVEIKNAEDDKLTEQQFNDMDAQGWEYVNGIDPVRMIFKKKS